MDISADAGAADAGAVDDATVDTARDEPDGGPKTQPDAGPEPEVPQDAAPSSDAAEADASADAGAPDVALACDNASLTDPPESSMMCGDGIRDPLLEACDDGEDSADDACSADCVSRDLTVVDRMVNISEEDPPIVMVRPRRSLGHGAHVVAGGPNGFAITYTEEDADFSVQVQFFDNSGSRRGPPLRVSPNPVPPSSGPAIAAVPDCGFIVAYVGSLNGSHNRGLLQRMDMELGADGDPVALEADVAEADRSADLVWTGQELIVAWNELYTLKYRRFDLELKPLDKAEVLSDAGEYNSGVTLARFGTGWAAAWLSVEGGSVRLHARAGDVEWETPAALPSPAPDDRPALIALDERHLLAFYSEGIPPQGGGNNIGRLRLAVLDTDAPGLTMPVALQPSIASYDDPSLTQARPVAVQVFDTFYLAWQTESPLGDALRSQVFMQQVEWAPQDAILLQHEEIPLPAVGLLFEDQQNPHLGAAYVAPEGALVTAWEDRSTRLPGRPSQEVMMGLRPLPVLVPEPVVNMD